MIVRTSEIVNVIYFIWAKKSLNPHVTSRLMMMAETASPSRISAICIYDISVTSSITNYKHWRLLPELSSPRKYVLKNPSASWYPSMRRPMHHVALTREINVERTKILCTFIPLPTSSSSSSLLHLRFLPNVERLVWPIVALINAPVVQKIDHSI